jgi:hypothetical protein
MGRLWTCGAETGLLAECGVQVGRVNCSVSNAQVRSGAYSIYMAPGNGTEVGLGGRGFDYPATQEIFWRVAVHFTGAIVNYESMFIAFTDASGATHLTLTLKAGTSLIFNLKRGTYNGTLLATGPTTFDSNTWYLLEGRVKIDDLDGIFQLKVNGSEALEFDFAGDTRNAGNDSTTRMIVGQQHQPASSTEPGIYFDDLAIADDGWIGDGAVLLLRPTGNGASSQWTGSDNDQVDNYALVDEVPPATADYVKTLDADQVDTYALGNVPVQYNAVRLVQPISYAALNVAGVGSLKGVLRCSDGDHEDVAATSLGTSYAFIRGDIYYVDPADSQPWTTARVDALEVGVKSV